MLLLNKPNFITININSKVEFDSISSKIKDKISDTIIRSNKIIIFPKNENLKQRVDFIKNIDDSFKIEEIINKNIMIFLEDKNYLEYCSKFEIIVTKNLNTIEIKYSDKIDKKMKIFFQSIFKKCDIVFSDYMTSIKIEKNHKKNVENIIEKLENKSTIFGKPCSFIVKVKDANNIEVISSLLENEFKILNLNKYDNYISFKKKYKTLSRKYHPDLNKFNNDLLDKIYQKRFQNIQQAYKELKFYYKDNMVA